MPTPGGATFGPPKTSRSQRTIALDADTVSALREHITPGRCTRCATRAATLALTAGVAVHIVAARLGDDPKIVLGTYAHLLPQSDEMAAQCVTAALAPVSAS